MDKTPRTRHGYSMFDMSSLIQKSLRRCDETSAFYAAYELADKYRKYLWKRMLCVSAEDCYDLVTESVMFLCEEDMKKKNDKLISTAVSILLKAMKNRDADYFACNLLNSRDVKDISKYVRNVRNDNSCPTKNGHSMIDLTECFDNAYLVKDDEYMGYSLNEILVYYRKYSWKMLKGKAVSLGKRIFEEVKALERADEFTEHNSIIYHAKALTSILKVVKYGTVSMFSEPVYDENADINKYSMLLFKVPEYVYDCHTYIGKRRGKTKRDFIVEEQNALSPFKKGEYDDSSWEHFLWLCDNGFWTDEYTPRPDKGKIKEINDGSLQMSLF